MFEFDDLDAAASSGAAAERQGPVADLLSEDVDVRWRACLELKKSGIAADIPMLEALLVSEKIADVRRAAKKAIQEIRHPVVRPDVERAAQVAAAQAQWQAAVAVTEPYEAAAADEEMERAEVPPAEEFLARDVFYQGTKVFRVPEPEVMDEPVATEQPREAAESEVVPMSPIFVLAEFDDDADDLEPTRRDLTFVDRCNMTFEQQLLKKHQASGKAIKRPPRPAQPAGVGGDASAATASNPSTAPAPAAGQPSNGDLKQALFQVFKEVLPMRLSREAMTPTEIADVWENIWGVQYASRVRFQAPPDRGTKWLNPRDDIVPCSPTVVQLEASRGAVLYSLATALKTFGGLTMEEATLERERRFQRAALDEEKRAKADAKEVSRYQKFEVRRWYDKRHQ